MAAGGAPFRIAAGPVTKSIAAINIALAVLMLVPVLDAMLVAAGALIPARLSVGDGVMPQGLFLLPAWLTPISSAFLHGGFLHVSLNMLMLLITGPNIERVLGSKGFAMLYGAGILAAGAAEFAANPASTTPVVGASGAISAIFAAHMQLFPRERPKPLGPIPAKLVHAIKLMLGWILLNLMIGFVAPGLGVGIAIWAHIGGFAAGLLLTWPLLNWRYNDA
jgi:membrane associated rhomboid family serine protease